MGKALSMYVVTHKQMSHEVVGRTVIGVGNKPIEGVTIYDNCGDNISEKNKNYCELTALYWIWKNDKDSKYIGIEHYRRFFCENISIFRPNVLSNQKIEEILTKYDCISPRKIRFDQSIYEFYKSNHIIEDLDKCREYIKEHKAEYLKDYDDVINGYEMSICNMAIMPREIFCNYCEWLFDILFSVEKEIDLEKRDSYQKRVYGFLSERLLNVWLHHQKLNIYYCKIEQTEKHFFLKKIKNFAKKLLKRG